MYIVSQLLSRVGALLGTGTPQEADSAIILPNTLLAPLPFPMPHPANLTATYTDSFCACLQSTITNTPGGATQSFMTLVPGLWEIGYTIDSEFNWLNVNPIAQDNRLVLTQQTVNNFEVWSMAARATRTVVDISQRKYTLDRNTTVRLLQNGNGVGQTSTFQVNIHAERFL